MEVLVAGLIGGVIMLGSVHGLNFALQAGGISRAILTENDFKVTLSKAIDNCNENFDHRPPLNRITNSVETEKKKGIGTITSIYSQGVKIIETGDYRGEIEVVKMELKGDSTKTPRTFIAYL